MRAILSLFAFVLLATSTPLVAEAVRDDPVEGHWEGTVMAVPGQVEAEVIVELDRVEGWWTGEIAIPMLGLEHHPLKDIQVQERQVSFVFENLEGVRSFEGEVTDDGRVLAGYYARDGERMRFELDRKGEPGEGAGLPVAAELHHLSGGDSAELRERFNADRGAVRVLTILSPTCSQCLVNAAIMQRALLNKTDAQDLRVYVLWLSLLDGDDREDAERASTRFRDPRVTQYWGDDTGLARQLARVLGTEDELVWDVVVVYPEGIRWEGELPEPVDWMIARGDVDLLKRSGFDGERLAETVNGFLTSP